MPLTDFQAAIARLLSTNRGPDSYLAGGAALHIEAESARYSNDLDYFNDTEQRVAEAYSADRAVLEAHEYDVSVVLERPSFVRAIVEKDGESTKLEWAHDTSWRFMPSVRSDVAGYQMHPVDLAVNKLLAVVGRSEPRDLLDLLEADRSILPLGALVWAAAGKDPGFTPTLLMDLLRRRGRLRQEDLARLRLTTTPDVRQLKLQWLSALDRADEFLASRPPEEAGCLYYSPETRRFVGEPDAARSAVPHHGRPGGSLPPGD